MSETNIGIEPKVESPEIIVTKPQLDIKKILVQESNPMINGLSVDEARSLIPLIITHLKDVIDKEDNQSDSRSDNQTFQIDDSKIVESRAWIFFRKYADIEDTKYAYSLLDDKKGAVKRAGIRVMLGLLSKEPDDSHFFHEQFFKRIIHGAQESETSRLLVETVNAIVCELEVDALPFFLTELSHVPLDNKVKEALVQVANNFQFLETIDICRKLIKGAKSDEEKQALENMIEFLEPSKESQERVESLEDLYERINFENYDINQKVNEYETNLLTQTFPDKTAPYLDIGCGTGRLIKSLNEEGYTDLHGIDLTQKHIEVAKKAVPDAKLTMGKWNNLPYPDKYFQGAYIFGRSVLHNLDVMDLEWAFGHAKRVIRDDGSLLLDLPDVTKGSYASEVKHFSDEAKSKGIVNFREGFIYDSPDATHYYNRGTLSRKQMEALCELTGFNIEKVTEHEIPNSKGDVNLYYELKKNHNYNFNDIQPERLCELWGLFNPFSASLLQSNLPFEISPPQTKPDQTKPPSSEQSEDDL